MPAEAAIHPFPGLRPFEEDEHDLFFGREGQSEEILAGLRQHRFVAVVGASGSGKSSLVRAGLLPYLHGGFLAGAGSHWRIAIFRPGGDPIKNLATALDQPQVIGREAPNAEAASQSAVLLEVSLRRSGLGLIEAIRLARLPPDEQVLVVVDQFEELFRFAGATDRPGADEDAAAFVKLLLEASRQRELPIYVVLTMRSDYIGDCARYRDLPEAVTSGLYLIPRMTRDQRRAAIVEPVRVGGGAIAPRLVTRLLNDVGDDPDQLPILQHALMRSWDYWQVNGGGKRPLDVDDYVAIGGMAEALSQHAEEAYADLPDDRHREIAKRIFQALSDKGPDNREARRPTAIAKLAQIADVPEDDIIRVVEEFRAPGRSFLMPAAGIALKTDAVIDISHESLIRGWSRMRQWVEEEAESARVYRRLADTALLHAQGTAGLLHDPDLENVLAWRDRVQPNAAWGDRYQPGFGAAIAFLEQSRLARDTERRQRHWARRRLQLAGLASTALIAIVALVAVVAAWQAKIASDRAQQTLTMTNQIALSLVFDLGQDPRVQALPKDILTKLLNDAIQGFTKVIADKPSSETYQGRGVAYRVEGKLDLAMADYNQAIQLDPKNQYAYNSRGNVYGDKGDYDRAIADYTKALTLDPKYAAAYDNRGLAYNHKNDHDHAIADYTSAIALDSKTASYYVDRGIAYNGNRKYDLAIADYSRAIGLDPNYFWAYNDRGRAYYNKNDYAHAIADYDKAIAIDPKNAVAYDNRGDAYRAERIYDRAIASYSSAVALDPKNASYRVDRGLAYSSNKQYDLAIADDSEAIRLDPKYFWAYNNRGYAYYNKKDYDHAIVDYTKAIAIDPKNAVAHDNRGNAYDGKRDYDHAIADYTKAIDLDPKNSSFYNDRGTVYQAKADYDRAIADYNQAIAIDPKNVNAYYNRGLAYRLKDDLDRAVADYTQVIAIDPKYTDAYYGRAIAYRKKGKLDRAIADYTKAIALNPRLADAYNGRGITYDRMGDFNHAVTDYSSAIAIDPKDTDAYYNRGLAYKNQGDLGRAIADYTQVIAIDPKYTDAYYGRAIAYRNKGEFDRAIADYTQAIALNPRSANTFAGRGNAYKDINDYPRAIADFDQAVALDPRDDWAFLNRGLAKLYSGSPTQAVADIEQAREVNPKFAYNSLWLEIVNKRSNRPSQLAQAVAQIDMSKWPAPIVRLYLGQMTAEQVLDAAHDTNAKTQANQMCEANFYAGELALRRRDTALAKRLFTLADAGCPKDYAEWPAARAELTALGEKPK